MTDEKLFNLCRFYGVRALSARQNFLGLLPEVYKRRLYEKKNFSSIFEFAKKLCGVSEKQVRMVLGLYEKFEEMPALRNALQSGEVSANKLARIASIATAENQSEICEKAKILSKATLEVYVRDIKNGGRCETEGGKLENQNGLFETKNEAKSLPGQNSLLNDEVIEKLSELKEKGIDINEMLLEFLKKREETIEQKKNEISREIAEKREKAKKNGETAKNESKYISVKIRKILHDEFGTKCAVPGCNKPAKHIHHAIPFAVGKTNDPRFLIPFCEEHHKIAHLNNVKYAEIRRK